MSFRLLTLVLWGNVSLVFAQNLLENPGFEKNLACSDPTIAQPCAPWDILGTNFETVSGEGFPNFCSTGHDQINGSDMYFTGDGAAETGKQTDPQTGATRFRYLVQPLSEPLEAGATYIFSMQVLNNLGPSKQADFGKIGAWFSENLPQAHPSGTLPDFNPQVSNADPIEGLGWAQVQGCFLANGLERYLIVGILSRPDTLNPDLPDYGFFVDDLQLARVEAPADMGIRVVHRSDSLWVLDASISDISPDFAPSYRWQTGDTSATLSVRSPGFYKVEVQAGCFSFEDTVRVVFQKPFQDFYAPNIFSPNHDGENDFFLPQFVANRPLADFRLDVYDRWGNLVFRGTDLSEGWNGLYKGKASPEGLYQWLMTWHFADPKAAENEVAAGDVFLIR